MTIGLEIGAIGNSIVNGQFNRRSTINCNRQLNRQSAIQSPIPIRNQSPIRQSQSIQQSNDTRRAGRLSSDDERIRSSAMSVPRRATSRRSTRSTAAGGAGAPMLTALTRDATHAQDLLQETFLQLHRSRRACGDRPSGRGSSDREARGHGSAHAVAPASDRRQLPELPVPAEIGGSAIASAARAGRGAPDRVRRLPLHHVWDSASPDAQLLGISTAAAKLRSSRDRGRRQHLRR